LDGISELTEGRSTTKIEHGGTAMTAAMTIPRLYTDESGESRFDTYDVPMALHQHAPPAAPFLLTEPERATQYMLFRIPPGWNGGQHTTPNHRLVICLSGTLRFIGSAGDTLTLRPGDRMMDMNTAGKGHATEVLSEEPVEGMIIRVD
jgi:quercetin dioxygenase-like cupin family protein